MVSLLGLSSPSHSARCFFDINSCVGFIGASILITAQTQNSLGVASTERGLLGGGGVWGQLVEQPATC